MVLSISERLSDTIIKILDTTNPAIDFQPPEFHLGELPKLDQPLAFEQPPQVYTSDEEQIQLAREGQTPHSQELLRQANKTQADLKDNPSLQDTLAHSEKLLIESRRMGGGFIQKSLFPTP
jgi:hypothetical protein